MKEPAFASAARPAVRPAFQSGQAWIMCGQISRVTAMLAVPAASAKRVASASSVSSLPT
ncbi:MAG: hypothetical protein OJF58_003402 [Enhydrobacter sp.]|nr:MAG: hypothetical protein OJF58_003402 [Enhydrobacter sp.]